VENLFPVRKPAVLLRSRTAGGRPGEIGGDLWRSGDYGYYADRIGPLSLDRKLEARGRVTMLAGGPDADMMLGWFSGRDNPATKDASPLEAGNFIGVAVGGPTRVGHYFAPSLTTAKGSRGKVDSAPLLRPGVNYEWSLVYDPDAAGGRGAITVRLGDESVTLALKPGQKAEGARLDRFGLFTSQAGGQMVRIYLDDVSYSQPQDRAAAQRPDRFGAAGRSEDSARSARGPSGGRRHRKA